MPRATRSTQSLPVIVGEELLALGKSLEVARKRRRMPRRVMAERMMVNVKTVERMEKGDPSLGIGMVATALWVLGMQRRLGNWFRLKAIT